MLSDFIISPTGAIRTRCSNTQSLPPRSWHSVRLISGPVSRWRSTSAEYSFALSRAGARVESDSSTWSAICKKNSSSGKLGIFPPFSKFGSGTRQQSLDRFFRLASFEGNLAGRSPLPIPPDQCQAVLLRKARHHTPRVLSQLLRLQQLREVGR